MNHNINFELQRKRLSGLEVSDAFLARKDLRGAVAQSSSWLGCTFEDVRFDKGALGDTLFDRCRFIRCTFDGAALVSRIHRSSFSTCTFDDTNFSGAIIVASTLSGRAQGSIWSRATIENSCIQLDLRAADLDFAFTRGVDFSGSNLWSARLPMNCAMFSGNVFDERQIGCLLSLISTSASDRSALDTLETFPRMEYWKKLVKRIAQPAARMVN